MEKPGGKGMAAMTERERRVQWFQEARFGMFLSIPIRCRTRTTPFWKLNINRIGVFPEAEKQALAIKSVLCYDNRNHERRYGRASTGIRRNVP